MIGGPPCPDFSVGGKNEGGKGLNGRLSKTYIRRICGIKPSFFVFENVPGLMMFNENSTLYYDIDNKCFIFTYIII